MGKFECWTVAYRLRNMEETLLENHVSPFTVINNSWRYWYADPHLIERDGRTWVFAEQYDRILRRGLIGCCELTTFGATPWKTVLKMPFHLSYPHLTSSGTEIYMIPESYVADEIAVYRADSFPGQWKKTRVLKDSFCAVDSTTFKDDGKYWMLTLRFVDDQEQIVLFPLDEIGICGEGVCIAENDLNKRPAGNFFVVGNKLVRPAQDCTESYGCALNFYEVTEVTEASYQETLLAKVKPSDLKTNLGSAPAGIHTYNFTKTYEVIDLKTYEIDWLFYLMRPIWFVWHRVRKLWKRRA